MLSPGYWPITQYLWVLIKTSEKEREEETKHRSVHIAVTLIFRCVNYGLHQILVISVWNWKMNFMILWKKKLRFV